MQMLKGTELSEVFILREWCAMTFTVTRAHINQTANWHFLTLVKYKSNLYLQA